MLLEMWIHDEERQEVEREAERENKEAESSTEGAAATYPGIGYQTSTAILARVHSTGKQSRLRRALNLARWVI